MKSYVCDFKFQIETFNSQKNSVFEWKTLCSKNYEEKSAKLPAYLYDYKQA